jgi:hypothetical protein
MSKVSISTYIEEYNSFSSSYVEMRDFDFSRINDDDLVVLGDIKIEIDDIILLNEEISIDISSFYRGVVSNYCEWDGASCLKFHLFSIPVQIIVNIVDNSNSIVSILAGAGLVSSGKKFNEVKVNTGIFLNKLLSESIEFIDRVSLGCPDFYESETLECVRKIKKSLSN